MKIKISEKPDGNIHIYPYWTEDDKYDNYIPKEINKIIKSGKKYFLLKDQTKRFFVKDKEIIIVNIGKIDKIDSETIRQFSSIVCSLSAKEKFKSANMHIYPKAWPVSSNEIINAIYEGLFLTNYKYKGFKSKDEDDFKIENINVITKEKIKNVKKIELKNKIVSESVFLTRDLVNGPANIVTIDYIEKFVTEIARKNSLDINVFRKNDLKKKGMNLILAVGEGGKQSPRLIELQYNNSKKAPLICLIGKGIVFDSGGLNIKTGNYMDDMKTDMGGAATVIGIINAVSKLKIPVNILAYLPLAENSVDGNSFRPGDVIVGYNKKSVEIKNTDAEGRLILADSLAYSDKKSPDITIDFATLTGAAVVALGTKITAGFFRDNDIKNKILDSSKRTGEVIWELPLFDGYKEYLKNDIADISNIGSPPREAGTIVASLFLSEFIENKKWVHFDIAGPAYVNKESYYNPKGATGVLIRTIVDFIENY